MTLSFFKFNIQCKNKNKTTILLTLNFLHRPLQSTGCSNTENNKAMQCCEVQATIQQF